MTIQLGLQETQCLKPRITVFGVGGAGGNAVNNMILSELPGVDFVVANTDAQALGQSLAERKIQFGTSITQGLGAGSHPDIGKAAAEEAMEQLLEQLNGSHMVFITAGMGGGTGTGAAPVVARAAREQKMLTVGVVTKPFDFEGRRRMELAEKGIEELQHEVDTLIIIPNQNLFRVANDKTTFADAFKMADDVLHAGVRGVTDLMVQPGLINLDFADVRRVMSERGKAMMGTGEASGENRALDAAEAAIANPLLDEVSMKGANGVLINVTGGNDMTLFEVDEAAKRIGNEVEAEATITFGATLDEELDGRIRVSLVATGIEADSVLADAPVERPRLVPIDGGQRHRDSSAAPPAASGRPGGLPGDGRAEGTTGAAVAPAAALNPAPAPVAVEVKPAPMFPDIEARETGAGETTETGSAPAAARKKEPDAFIPPRPVQPAVRASSPSDPGPSADDADKAEPARRPTLLERMTGTGRSSRGIPEAPAREPVIVAADPGPAGSEEVMSAAPAEDPAVVSAGPGDADHGQSSLSCAVGMAPEPGDDVLDIPPFLRRSHS